MICALRGLPPTPSLLTARDASRHPAPVTPRAPFYRPIGRIVVELIENRFANTVPRVAGGLPGRAAGRSRPVGGRWVRGRGRPGREGVQMSRPEAAPHRGSPRDLREPPSDLPDLLGRLARRDPAADVVLDRAVDGTR